MKKLFFALMLLFSFPEVFSQNYLYSTVDKLSVRRSPDLKSKRITSLDEGERVTDLGQSSRNIVSVKLRGVQTKGPFDLIRTRKGVEGWVYSPALSTRPVYVENYVTIVAFSKYGRIDSRVKSVIRDYNDMYIDPIFSKADNYGYKFITRNFKEVSIENAYGNIIGVENISSLVDKYKDGVVILRKGKKQHHIDIVPQRVGDKWHSWHLTCSIDNIVQAMQTDECYSEW